MRPEPGSIRDRSTFVLLSGGQSRRMGRDKAFLAVDGREMLDRLLEVGRSTCSTCVLVVGEPGPYAEAVLRYGWEERDPGRRTSGGAGAAPSPVPAGRFRRADASLELVTDRHPGLGPVAGLEAGLEAAPTDLCFVAACDLPFLEAAVARALLRELDTLLSSAACEDGCAVVPVVEGRLQPLAAAYASEAASAARRCLERRALRMEDLLEHLEVRTVDAGAVIASEAGEAEWPFTNVNTPEELRAARREARDDP